MKEEKLIFIISQPRAGSTLLQKVLSNHPKIATTSEPWIIFSIVACLRPDLIKGKYNEKVATAAILDFLKKTKQEDQLFKGLKEVLLDIYQQAKGQSDFFLDKTPRYYELLPQLFKLFPRSRYIILKRNPYAVLYSMIQTWAKSEIDFLKLSTFSRDFLDAPLLIQDFFNQVKGNSNIKEIKYEQLVVNPHSISRELFEWLGIKFDASFLDISKNKGTAWKLGDDVYEKSIDYKYQITDKSKVQWKSALSDAKYLSFLGGYGHYIGHEFIRQYGYEPLEKQYKKKNCKLFNELIFLNKHPELTKHSWGDWLRLTYKKLMLYS